MTVVGRVLVELTVVVGSQSLVVSTQQCVEKFRHGGAVSDVLLAVLYLTWSISTSAIWDPLAILAAFAQSLHTSVETTTKD